MILIMVLFSSVCCLILQPVLPLCQVTQGLKSILRKGKIVQCNYLTPSENVDKVLFFMASPGKRAKNFETYNFLFFSLVKPFKYSNSLLAWVIVGQSTRVYKSHTLKVQTK